MDVSLATFVENFPIKLFPRNIYIERLDDSKKNEMYLRRDSYSREKGCQDESSTKA